jgi:N-acetylneuraminate synthase
MSEIREAVSHLKQLDEQEFVLLQCVSAYPTPLDDINVRVIERYREEFNVPTGLSDHTLDPTVAPTVATALGASIIEKHFTLDRTLDGPDHEFALEPDELDEMVSAVRRAERTLGSGIKEVVDAERELYKKARRYVQAVVDIEAGDQLSENDIAVLAPGERRRGVDPKHYDEIVGKQAVTDIRAGQGVRWDDVE